MREKNNSKKNPSFRIAHCGIFPNYYLGEVPLNEKNIIYLVSVGKEKFKGKWVERFVNFIKEIKPKKTIIVVADSLQRFNIELDENISEIDALRESEKRGQQWVEKYKPYFSKLDIDYEFIHWEKLKQDEDYQKYFNEIMIWNESDDFKQLILASAKAYIGRFDRKLHENKAIKQSSKFLNEESAVLRVLAKNVNTIGLVYPGPPLKIFNYIINYANKSRLADKFSYMELIPTKKKKKQKDNVLNLLEELPFFKCRKLSIDFDESKNECFLLPKSCL
ncbi:MAG: hypothetical protein WCE22_06100 [Candidatus Aquirickettsiella gammari]|jgi:hypothetical protein